MVLVDTSVWIAHFRKGDHHLIKLLNEGNVACHPFVVGELACGHLKKRSEILELLNALPMCQRVEQEEVLQFIEKHRIMGLGLGYVDVSLLASALLSTARFWTHDKRLIEAAALLSLKYETSYWIR